MMHSSALHNNHTVLFISCFPHFPSEPSVVFVFAFYIIHTVSVDAAVPIELCRLYRHVVRMLQWAGGGRYIKPVGARLGLVKVVQHDGSFVPARRVRRTVALRFCARSTVAQ